LKILNGGHRKVVAYDPPTKLKFSATNTSPQ
jgi:hypothetical protein